jgi:hypothetical protein
MTWISVCKAGFLAAAAALGAQAAGLQAELRSSAAILSPPPPGMVAPTAPAGGIVIGPQAWTCDAWQGFAPVVAADTNAIDPVLAIATTGIRLPISSTTTPATCGQAALQSGGAVYITQGVVDTRNTPSTARGVLRTALDPATGALIGPSTYIATTAGLDGDQPTAAAIGPDGNLYVGFLKSGNVKRILNPGVGSTQTVQSVGATPQGHPARAFAFVGNNLYVASVDSLSVIANAVNPACLGGCNAVAVSDGFSGVAHTGIAYDGADGVYFAVAPSAPAPGQVWRVSLSTSQFTLVSQGGADRNGGNAGNFSFAAGKTNLLTFDGSGNLWIGDDTSNATAIGAGRLWTISSAMLASLGPAPGGGTNLQAILNVLNEPWFVSLTNLFVSPNVTTQVVATFIPGGTFTATLTTSTGVTTTSGTWSLMPPKIVQPFANPQGHLTLTDSQGVVLFSNDILLENVDRFVSLVTGTGSLGAQFGATWIKFAP